MSTTNDHAELDSSFARRWNRDPRVAVFILDYMDRRRGEVVSITELNRLILERFSDVDSPPWWRRIWSRMLYR